MIRVPTEQTAVIPSVHISVHSSETIRHGIHGVCAMKVNIPGRNWESTSRKLVVHHGVFLLKRMQILKTWTTPNSDFLIPSLISGHSFGAAELLEIRDGSFVKVMMSGRISRTKSWDIVAQVVYILRYFVVLLILNCCLHLSFPEPLSVLSVQVEE